MNRKITKKMYKKPEIETTPVEPANILCVSGDGRVGVESHTPMDSYKVY